VAGGLVDFAIGSDTGGSVRAPASFCGIYGLRPTHGRISLAGACPLAPTFDTCGWFARDPAVMASVGGVLLGRALPALPSGLRVLMATDTFAQAAPQVVHALAPAVARVETRFGRAEPVVLAPDGLASWFEVFRVLQYADIWQTHEAWVQSTRPAFGAQVATRFEAVSQVDMREASAMNARRDAIRTHLAGLLAGDTVLLMPTAPDVAPRCGLPPRETVEVRERMLKLLSPAGLGGLPQLSLPVATVDGVPVGLSLLAAAGQDELLLTMALALHAE
jgi:amidase